MRCCRFLLSFDLISISLFHEIHSERVIGVDNVRKEARMSVVFKMKEVQQALLEAENDDEVFAEPTVKLAAEGKLDELLGIITAKEKTS